MKIKIKLPNKTTDQLVIIPLLPGDMKSKDFKTFCKKEILSKKILASFSAEQGTSLILAGEQTKQIILLGLGCLLYTSDAADE